MIFCYLCGETITLPIMDHLQTIDIRRFRKMFPGELDARLGDDFFITELKFSQNDPLYDSGLKMIEYPCRVDGFMAIFCIKGHFKMDINLHTFDVRENALVCSVPGYIIRVSDLDRSQDMHFVVAAISGEYMSSLRFDFNKLFTESLSLLNSPGMVLSEEELGICRRYLRLALDIMDTDIANKKVIIGALLSSIFYYLASVWSEELSKMRQTTAGGNARAKMLFEQFLHLVAEYHTSQRNMGFYADKMCLTPKYLSKLVKQVSGRSGPDWVDSFVILEAKNMLKYSDMSIKEIVYQLHFPNQSVFYKFFKSHTGLTPSQYRAS